MMTRCNLHKITRLIRTITRDYMEENCPSSIKTAPLFQFFKRQKREIYPKNRKIGGQNRSDFWL